MTWSRADFRPRVSRWLWPQGPRSSALGAPPTHLRPVQAEDGLRRAFAPGSGRKDGSRAQRRATWSLPQSGVPPQTCWQRVTSARSVELFCAGSERRYGRRRIRRAAMCCSRRENFRMRCRVAERHRSDGQVRPYCAHLSWRQAGRASGQLQHPATKGFVNQRNWDSNPRRTEAPVLEAGEIGPCSPRR
jgi:hypothetical protein